MKCNEREEGYIRMSLLNYFQKLPPDTPNVASAFSGLTSQETEDVSKDLKKMQDKEKKRNKYCMWKPQQWLEIGKHAAKTGNVSTLRFLSSIYLRLAEFKKAYNEGKQKGADLSEGIAMKSRGRPTLLPEALMKKQ